MKKIIYGLALAAVTLASCSDFLDKEPSNKLDASKFFANESELALYANGLYVDMIPSAEELTNSGSGTCDYLATSTTSSLLMSDFNADKMSGWTYGAWTNLYRCNYFLKNIDKAAATTDAATLNHYRGVAKFWRAYFYFDKVKTYGNVPWYSEPIDAGDSIQLYKERDSREVIMDSVLQDINYACQYIRGGKEELVSRYAALALKSRICLFEGTYRKYHAVNPSTNQPWQEADGARKYLQACVDASEELMKSGEYSLVNTGKPATDYRSLFQSEKPNTTEIIMAREYSADLQSTHNVTQKFNSAGNDTRRWSPTQDFVNTYLNLDGSRFTDAADYDKKTFAENCTNRDYRLQQSVITPTYIKNINGTPSRYNATWAVTMTGYQVIKFNMDDTYYEQTSRCSNAIPIFQIGRAHV